MVLDKSKTYKNLKKKGFLDSTGHSSDHKYMEYYVRGKLVLYTKISHGSDKDLNEHLIKQMSSQCKLTKKQFADLVNCPMSQDEYLDILKEIGTLE
jgi:hypothetical protein